MHKHLRTGILMATVTAAMSLAPAADAAMPGGSTIYAGLWTTQAATPVYGIYTLSEDGAELLMRDPKGPEVGFPLRSAWLVDGTLCGYYVKENYSVVEQHYYMEADFATGAVSQFTPLSIDNGYMFSAVYNPDDCCVYGYGLTGDFSYALMKASADNPGDLQVVRTFEWDADEECLSIAYNTADQKLYGINARREFVTVNPANGAQTVVAQVPVEADIMVCGLCYAPKENLFYWNPQFGTDSAIYTITPDGSAFTKVCDCLFGEQYNFFICPDKAGSQASPASPVIKAVNFDGGATTGSIVITMPSQTLGGEALAGTLGWEAVVDGTPFTDGTAQPGADVTVNFTDVPEGNHVFTFRTVADGQASENVSHAMWVGTDTPRATAQVTLTHDRVIWEPVTEGVNGGYIDLDNLQYVVSLNDEPAFTQPAVNLWGYHQLATAELKRYTASVVVMAGGKRSQATLSNEVALGTPLQPDFTLVPDRDDVDRMTVIDVNGDGRTWSYSLYQECAKSSFGSGVPMDDWLVLSPVAFKAETSYTLKIDVQTCNSTYTDEFMRVCIGSEPTPEAMTRELIATFRPEREIGTRSADFTVPEDGTYYIGFHTTSFADMEGILLSNIRLNPTGQGAIDGIGTDSTNAPAEYYNLQGVRVAAPGPGVWIERRGTSARKIHIM